MLAWVVKVITLWIFVIGFVPAVSALTQYLLEIMVVINTGL